MNNNLPWTRSRCTHPANVTVSPTFASRSSPHVCVLYFDFNDNISVPLFLRGGKSGILPAPVFCFIPGARMISRGATPGLLLLCVWVLATPWVSVTSPPPRPKICGYHNPKKIKTQVLSADGNPHLALATVINLLPQDIRRGVQELFHPPEQGMRNIFINVNHPIVDGHQPHLHPYRIFR